MDAEEFIDYIEEKIYPYTLHENGRANISSLFRKYSEDLLIECVDIGVSQYFQYDSNGNLTQDSAQQFLNKLGGIAYNKSRDPIDQEIHHQKNKCKKSYAYWNDGKAEEIFNDYIRALRNAGWSDEQVLNDLQTEVSRLTNSSHNWTQWSNQMLSWLHDIEHWNDKDTITIQQEESILPEALFLDLSPNFQSLCKQINASYENNLFDCTAVMMRRLLEGLLVLSYQNYGIESEITAKDHVHHVTLDKIIKNAEQNTVLELSGNTKKELMIFKDLGNYSAHKIWYNCTQQDIKPHILKYRVVIEELIYKSGLKG
ncbi:DUF4145 domain-containing protein [Bittarella massiliensis (ex Durand et al. 2017)]|uniref:DUF4145 domain-containing protein n=1 Tax=Bittarella massiliensis (ex Durand et al. 2017) TaxID=1720313 RepID=UPI001AA1B095|nr:DUF4145 domain-containing protein [Bittarella massiliensis (ex Durand et al. 2017)]MBO1679391.1 hypothetical protein [Bittarella massiliensis (ex Durand et al. 2017)]